MAKYQITAYVYDGDGFLEECWEPMPLSTYIECRNEIKKTMDENLNIVVMDIKLGEKVMKRFQRSNEITEISGENIQGMDEEGK